MNKKFLCLFGGVLLLQSFHIFAQTSVPDATFFTKEKQQFLGKLRAAAMDSVTANSLAGYFESEVNNISRSIANDKALPILEKEKAVRSLVFFMQALGKNLEKQSPDLYDIPGALNSYKSVLAALLHHQPLTQLLIPMPPYRSQLLATAFSQYKEYPLLDDMAVYKRMASTPGFILQFLENKPGFRFSDSLLLQAAANDPLKMAFYLNTDRPGVQDKIRKSSNIYLQQIVSLSQHKSASELLPFVKQIAEHKITPEEILTTRTDVVGYFQLLVNTLQESRQSTEPSSIFIQPLRTAIKQKALAFFVNEINDQHNASDAVRFVSVKGLRPEDIYYVITSCGEELYTSSYLGLYKRLMEQYTDRSIDSLFTMLQYDNLRTFMRLAANYNVLGGFLQNMPQPGRKELLTRFIGGICNDNAQEGLASAMDVADAFTALASVSEVSELTRSELQANLLGCKSAHQYLGVRLYTILSQVFDLIKQEGAVDKLWATLGNYEILKRNSLENKNGEIVQLVLFYGDEDGISSFNNFLQQFSDGSKWKITKTNNWVSIRSLSDHPVAIYANMPLDIKQELDVKAQDSLIAYLHEQSLDPVVLIHRGHSYHLDKTLKRLQPSVKLAILGSCGGYNKGISIAHFNPDVQVIGSKKIGSKSINDPIIEVINEAMLDQKDLVWPDIWKKLEERFSKDKVALGLFSEYFPPSNNISLFVLKLFMYSNKFV
jgi:hypothetical protein